LVVEKAFTAKRPFSFIKIYTKANRRGVLEDYFIGLREINKHRNKMDKTSDLHIHTLVSDGDAEPYELLLAAKEAGLKQISFTDHDALGAYRHFSADIFAQARELGLELVAGIELDTDYQNNEVHLLGYDIDLNNEALNAHLNLTQSMRKQRLALQIDLINRHFGRTIVDPAQVFVPKRDTLMKPHLVHAMLGQKLFSSYGEANRWLSESAKVSVEVPKLALADGVRMIRNAGGEAVLAHPGYLVREKDVSLEPLLTELIPLGLCGLEVEYPYMGTSRFFPDRRSEHDMVDELQSLADRLKLNATRGSDAHSVIALVRLNSRMI
jgi:3',5'-nucleoside bisphosphate phosphatase